MKSELKALEDHLRVLEKSNIELEQELNSFIQDDEHIKRQLRSRTPTKQRGFVGSGMKPATDDFKPS